MLFCVVFALSCSVIVGQPPYPSYAINSFRIIPGVLNTGTLAKAGDTVLGGAKIGIRDGHIPVPFERNNLYTGERELFDPNQVLPLTMLRNPKEA
jgi:hypothetical protein